MSEASQPLDHLDERGRPRMVDVGEKAVTQRHAEAEALVKMSPETRTALFAGELPKGDALAVIRIAAIMAAKRTPELVPLCHPLPLSSVSADVEETAEGARIVVSVGTTAQTGVEMEAMTAAAIGAVSLYDMIKGLERGAEIGPIRLLSKSGGRSGDWER